MLVMILLAIAGVGLLIVGLRGRRVDDVPWCAACRFDLSGLVSPAKCPECGADLHAPGAYQRGRRRARRGLVAVGSVLLLLAVGAVGVEVWTRAAKFDWNTVKPTWMLVRESRSLDVTAAAPALAELGMRLDEGRLSDGARAELIERGLAYQIDWSKPWMVEWGEVIETARRRGEVTDAQWRAYVRASLRLQARVVAGSDTTVLGSMLMRLGSGMVSVRFAPIDPQQLGPRVTMRISGGGRPQVTFVAKPERDKEGAQKLGLEIGVAVGGEPEVVWNEELVIENKK